jgi:hypothetical protein
LLLANATKLWPSSRKPAAISFSALHGLIESAATCARYSGVMSATDWLNVSLGLYVCFSIAGMNSGFSGASFARSSARRTTRSSAASSNSLMVATPTLLPYGHFDAEFGVVDDAAGGDVVQREADVAVDVAGQLRRCTGRPSTA